MKIDWKIIRNWALGEASEKEKQEVDTAFSFKKYCSSLVIVVKMLIFVHSDAEAPP